MTIQAEAWKFYDRDFAKKTFAASQKKGFRHIDQTDGVDGFVTINNITAAAEAKAHGMDVYYPSCAEIEAFRNLGQPDYVGWEKN